MAWCHELLARRLSLEELQSRIEQNIKRETTQSEAVEPYAPPAKSIASAREALRRAKYFSENYLNKEFDIFWSLANDKYLDVYYRQFTKINGGGTWFCHGNGGSFKKSAALSSMQMDNLSYNPKENLLVANELKLGGKRNRDQILKYALMYRILRNGKFIGQHTRFLLLFIGIAKEDRS